MLENFSTLRSTVEAYFAAFKTLPDAPRTIFARHGLGIVGPNGDFEIVDVAPLDKFILATNELLALVGPQKAFEIGTRIVDYAVRPGRANDLGSAMQLIDSGYHLNHLKDGQPMIDLETGTMLEGIGHYKCTMTSNHRAVMEVDTPYNCDLDRGIMQAWARLYEKTALVTHLEPSVCRKNRSRFCRYEVSWK